MTARDDKLAEKGVRHDRISALEVKMIYPLGFASIEYHQIAPTRSGNRKYLRVAMTAEEAMSLGLQLIRLSKAIEQAGGSKQ